MLSAALLLPAPAKAVSADHAYVLDGVTGRVLFEKNAGERGLIASTTKIMTALVVCEQCNVLDRMRIPREAVGIEGSSMYLKEGEVLTLQELLYGLMLSSGNDAADSAKIEQYMEQAVDKQLAAMRSSLPMKVSAGVVWKDVEKNKDGLRYIYQIDIDAMISSLPAELRQHIDENSKKEVLGKMKSTLCPQIKPMLCVSLDLISTFSPKLQRITATYLQTDGSEFAGCSYSLNDCAEELEQYNQKVSAAE